jgi:hypothetical protein
MKVWEFLGLNHQQWRLLDWMYIEVDEDNVKKYLMVY